MPWLSPRCCYWFGCCPRQSPGHFDSARSGDSLTGNPSQLGLTASKPDEADAVIAARSLAHTFIISGGPTRVVLSNHHWPHQSSIIHAHAWNTALKRFVDVTQATPSPVSPLSLRDARGVVTGGTGFLGSHVTDALTAAGCHVLVFDRVASTRGKSFVGDLSDVGALTSALEGADFVCHLAAVGDVYLAAEQPALAAAVNVVGTSNVCEAALRTGTKRLILASTWEVYGRPRYEPIDEDHPCEPDHPYSVTKLAGEQLAKSYGHLRGLDVVSLRLGTAFGTRMRPNSVFQIFIRRALSGQGIVVQGSGKQARQFTHASDIGRAFIAALERAPAGSTYNIVSDEHTSISELAEAVRALVPTEITFGSARPGDVASASVSNERARRELAWAPSTTLHDGLQEIVAELQ